MLALEMPHDCMLDVDSKAPIEGGLQSSSNTEVDLDKWKKFTYQSLHLS